MLIETREAGRDQAASSPGQGLLSSVADASADVRNVMGGHVSTSMKQNTTVDNVTESRQLAEPGLATTRVSKKLKVETSEGAESPPSDEVSRDARKTSPSQRASQMVGAGMDCRGEYPPMDPVRLQQQALPLGVDKPYELSSEHRLGVFAKSVSTCWITWLGESVPNLVDWDV